MVSVFKYPMNTYICGQYEGKHMILNEECDTDVIDTDVLTQCRHNSDNIDKMVRCWHISYNINITNLYQHCSQIISIYESYNSIFL